MLPVPPEMHWLPDLQSQCIPQHNYLDSARRVCTLELLNHLVESVSAGIVIRHHLA